MGGGVGWLGMYTDEGGKPPWLAIHLLLRVRVVRHLRGDRGRGRRSVRRHVRAAHLGLGVVSAVLLIRPLGRGTLLPPPAPEEERQAGDECEPEHGTDRNPDLGARGQPTVTSTTLLRGEEGRGLLLLVVQPSREDLAVRAPGPRLARVDGAAAHEGVRLGLGAGPPLHLGGVADAELGLEGVEGVLVEGGVLEVVVRAFARGRLARVDGAAADELGGLVVADVEGPSLGAGGAQ
ncbi:unnamed protein product [Clonostachys byssicola]|uniref:Uncharacterized protein n=1 Tax=Clonostachys byssicola TaxID=160290 RepID=A0A9N9Y4J0_9HYPO|nr:unnamed protein product [Clonostachys byssicola]